MVGGLYFRRVPQIEATLSWQGRDRPIEQDLYGILCVRLAVLKSVFASRLGGNA